MQALRGIKSELLSLMARYLAMTQTVLSSDLPLGMGYERMEKSDLQVRWQGWNTVGEVPDPI